MHENTSSPPQPSVSTGPAGGGDVLPPPQGSLLIIRVALILALILILPWCAVVAIRVGGIGVVTPVTLIATSAALLAAFLGALGFLLTRRGRRGRGKAVVAVVLGLIAAFLQYGVGALLYRRVAAEGVAVRAARILKTPRAEIQTAVRDWYDDFGSKRFCVNVTAEELEAWLEKVIDTHGHMQSGQLTRADVKFQNDVWTIPFSGQFVNGTRRVVVNVGFDEGDPRVDEIRVDDLSPDG